VDEQCLWSCLVPLACLFHRPSRLEIVRTSSGVTGHWLLSNRPKDTQDNYFDHLDTCPCGGYPISDPAGLDRDPLGELHDHMTKDIKPWTACPNIYHQLQQLLKSRLGFFFTKQIMSLYQKNLYRHFIISYLIQEKARRTGNAA